MDFRILGPLEIADGDVVLSLPGAQRSLLALLLLRANEVVSSDRLVEELWGERSPESGRAALQVRVSQLRKALGAAGALLVTRPPGYVLALDPEQLDLFRFERLVADADGTPPEVASVKLREALSLWRGPALADLAYEAGTQSAIRRLEELRLAAVERRIAADLALGHHADLIAELETLVAEHPLQEHLHAQRMLALYRCGRQADALAAYQDARRCLVDELGIEPAAELRELEQAILRQDPSLDASPAAGAAAPTPAPERLGSLPASVSSFVGRDRELADLRGLLAGGRVLTLTGVGGVGKTRLVLRLASSLSDRVADGVWFADLSGLSSPTFVAATVAGVLGVREEPGRPVADLLVGALRARESVLVLDNCEHVIAEAATLADRLMRSCPRLRILATSREPLRIDGEQIYRVPPLSVPSDGQDDADGVGASEAVGLFVERARAQRPGFMLAADNGERIAGICRRLDGVPLAIELAAARLHSLSLEDLDARLEHRFQLLTGGSRAALPRQQTLRALIDWSYDLLGPDEREMLERLSVFAGGFDLPAAEAVAGGDGCIDRLGALVDKSLVQLDAGAGARYRLLETVRDYASGKLDGRGEAAAADARNAHARHYLALAEEAAPQLMGHDQRHWLDRIEAEQDNLRAAMSAALHWPDPEPALRLASAQCPFWLYRRGIAEGQMTLRAALARPGVPELTIARGRALVAAANLLIAGDTAAAAARAEEGLAIAHALDDAELRCQALHVLAGVAANRRDDALTLELTKEGLELARMLEDPHLMACHLGIRSISPLLSGEERIRIGERCLGHFRESGDQIRYVRALGNLAYSHLAAGEVGLARRNFTEAMELFREDGDQGGLAVCVCNLAFAAYLDGADEEARGLFDELIGRAERDADLLLLAYGRLGLALLASRAGELETAAELHGAADALHEQLGTRVDGVESRPREQDLAALRTALGDDAFDAAYQLGRVRTSGAPPATPTAAASHARPGG